MRLLLQGTPQSFRRKIEKGFMNEAKFDFVQTSLLRAYADLCIQTDSSRINRR